MPPEDDRGMPSAIKLLTCIPCSQAGSIMAYMHVQVMNMRRSSRAHVPWRYLRDCMKRLTIQMLSVHAAPEARFAWIVSARAVRGT